MNLYLISQSINRDYDTFDSLVVTAEDENEAKLIHPQGTDFKVDEDGNFYRLFHWQTEDQKEYDADYSWVKNIKDVKVEYLGRAKDDAQNGIILSSFNAG